MVRLKIPTYSMATAAVSVTLPLAAGFLASGQRELAARPFAMHRLGARHWLSSDGYVRKNSWVQFRLIANGTPWHVQGRPLVQIASKQPIFALPAPFISE